MIVQSGSVSDLITSSLQTMRTRALLGSSSWEIKQQDHFFFLSVNYLPARGVGNLDNINSEADKTRESKYLQGKKYEWETGRRISSMATRTDVGLQS